MSPAQVHVLPPDAATYRTVLGHFATGVAIVTAMDGEEPGRDGVQLVHVGVARSRARVVLRGQVVDHVAAIAARRASGPRTFSTKTTRKRAACSRRRAPTASRTSRTRRVAAVRRSCDDALAFVDCETVAEHDAGDHVIVVGRVLELGYASEGKPLLFYRGGYGRFEI